MILDTFDLVESELRTRMKERTHQVMEKHKNQSVTISDSVLRRLDSRPTIETRGKIMESSLRLSANLLSAKYPTSESIVRFHLVFRETSVQQ